MKPNVTVVYRSDSGEQGGGGENKSIHVIWCQILVVVKNGLNSYGSL